MEYPERLELTDVERAFYEYDKSSPSNIVITAHLEGPLNAAMVEEALNHEKKRHFYLQYFIDSYENRPVFISDPDRDVPLKIHDDVPEDLWIRICEEEMNSHFDTGNAPMIKANLLKTDKERYTLIVTFSHIISDGISAAHFVKNVVCKLGEFSEGKKPKAFLPFIFKRPDSSFYPEAGGRKPKLSSGQLLQDGFTIQTDKPDSLPAVSKRAVEKQNKKSRLVPIALSTADSRMILERCHGIGITVNTLLSSAMIFAMRDYIEEKNPGESPVWIKASTALDLRRFIPEREVMPEDLGMWAGRCVLHLNLDRKVNRDEFFKSYHSALSEYIKKHPFYIVQSMAKGSEKTSSTQKEVIYPHIKITNMGDFNRQGIMTHYGKIKIKRMSVASAFHRDWINDYGFALLSSSFADSLILNFVYLESARTQKEAKRFVDSVLDRVKKY